MPRLNPSFMNKASPAPSSCKDFRFFNSGKCIKLISRLNAPSLCSRASPIFEEPAPVSYLPMELAVFKKLVAIFGIHPTIGRTIQRQVAHFEAQDIYDEELTDMKIGTSSLKRQSPRPEATGTKSQSKHILYAWPQLWRVT